jgi:hypothetical protein
LPCFEVSVNDLTRAGRPTSRIHRTHGAPEADFKGDRGLTRDAACVESPGRSDAVAGLTAADACHHLVAQPLDDVARPGTVVP